MQTEPNEGPQSSASDTEEHLPEIKGPRNIAASCLCVLSRGWTWCGQEAANNIAAVAQFPIGSSERHLAQKTAELSGSSLCAVTQDGILAAGTRGKCVSVHIA